MAQHKDKKHISTHNRPKKSLGQHFLTAPTIAAFMADQALLGGNMPVLEIGPGKGMLTKALLDVGARVVAIEKDTALVQKLNERFAGPIQAGNLTVIEGDALQFNPSTVGFSDGAYILAANIPYNITGLLLRKFIGGGILPKKAVLLVQKEVAERIVAKNGKESIVSLSVKAYGVPQYLRMVKPGSFTPQPSVFSAVLAIEDISRGFFKQHPKISEDTFFNLVKTGFAHKRKLLKNNLANIISPDVFLSCDIGQKTRAEDLTLSEWRCIAQHASLSTNVA